MNENKSYTVSNYLNCSCFEQNAVELPCRHVFYVRNYNNLVLFDQSMVHNRHKVTPESVKVPEYTTNYVTEISNIDTVESVLCQPKSKKAIYNDAVRIGQEIASLICKLEPEGVIFFMKHSFF